MLDEPLVLLEDYEPTSRRSSAAVSAGHSGLPAFTAAGGGISIAAADESLVFSGLPDTIASLDALTADVAHQQHRAVEARSSRQADDAVLHVSASPSATQVLSLSGPLAAADVADCPLPAMLGLPPPALCMDEDTVESDGLPSDFPSPTDATSNAEFVVAGRGASGQVALAYSPRIGARVAVKQIAACAAADRCAEIASEMAFAERVATVRSERPHTTSAIWSHLCEVHCASAERGTCTVVTEALLGGTLRDHAAAIASQRPELLRVVARHVLIALDTLHTRLRVVHNDLKLDNVMLAAPLDLSSNDDGPTFKVIDFGCASLLPLTPPSSGNDTHALPQRGSLQAMSPERLLGRRYGPKADVWSLGVLLLSLARGGKHPFLCSPASMAGTDSSPRAPSSTETFWRLAATMRFVDGDAACAEACDAVVGRSITDGALANTPAFGDFILRAMHTDPAQRADVATLLNHPWIQ